MKPTPPDILAYVLKTVQDLCQDWDYADPVGPESLLFTGLGMESLDAVVLCTAIQDHYRIQMPFAELLADMSGRMSARARQSPKSKLPRSDAHSKRLNSAK
jgi:acyl carrier protein